jgi:uncharacterized protein
MFKPAGIPAVSLEKISLGLDEMEAIRLADLLGLCHEEAARQMNISRPTFGRILNKAHKNVAEALTQGKVLCIEGGVVEMAPRRVFGCRACKVRWELPCGTGRPRRCPACKETDIFRVPCTKDAPARSGSGRGKPHNKRQKQARRPR